MPLLNSASLIALSTGLSFTLANPVLAQEVPVPVTAQAAPTIPDGSTSEDFDEDTILVLGATLAKQVDTAAAPILELEEEDIAAYGVGSIAELIAALGPQVSSARGRGGGGRPIILVNGERISSFRQLRSYPPEAIEKFEVFPEEVALEYGYSADQRVVNIILKDNFSSRELEMEYGQPFDGGFSVQEIEATLLQVNGPSRLNVNLGWNNSSLLTEAERNIIQSGDVPDLASDPDPAEYRSLISDSASLEATVNWTTRIGEGKSVSLNTTFERDDSLSLQGLDTVLLTDPSNNSLLRSLNVDDPLAIDRRTESYAAAGSLNMDLGSWQFEATVDGSHVNSRSMIERRADVSGLIADAAAGTLAIDADLGSLPDAGFDEALTKTDSISGLATLRGNPILLPAGDVSLTLDAGYDWNRIESEDTRNQGGATSLKRSDIGGGVNISIPLTSRDDEFLGAVGDFTFNASAGFNDLSDFGTLYDWSTGLTWGVTDSLTVSASYINRDTPPSLAQLGNPEVATLNVPIFDLANNETVLATVITGGNSFLPAQNQSDWKVGANWRLPFLDNASLSIDYIKNKSTDVTQGFPVLTPEIEAAFPGRITRDNSGTLVQLDQRPVTYAQQDEERLQFNFNVSGQISAPSEDDDNDSQGGSGNSRSGSPVAMAGGAMSAAPGGFGGAQAGAGGGRFAQMRQTFCQADPDVIRPQLNAALAAQAAGEPMPEGMNLPPRMLQRISGGDGDVSAEDLNNLRNMMCSGDGPPAGVGGGFRGNPERIAQLRATFCEADSEAMREQFNRTLRAIESGETITTEEGGEVINIPPQLLQRMSGGDGVIDEAEFAAISDRICNAQSPAQAGSGRGSAAGGPPAAGPARQAAGSSRPAASGRRGGGGPRIPFGPRGNGGRWFMNLQYNLELDNQVLVAPGGPTLDLLNGDALSGGGQAKHSFNLRFGAFYNGFGMRWDGRYEGKSSIDGTGLPNSTDLAFDDIFTLNVRMFADLGRRENLVEKVPLLANTRISLAIDNVFDARQTVTDSNGDVPLRYQPFLIDPEGRSFEIEFRKLF